MTDPDDIADREPPPADWTANLNFGDRESVLAEYESDLQLAEDLLADEDAAAARFDDQNRFDPRWAFLP